jgi:hypothetical protein
MDLRTHLAKARESRDPKAVANAARKNGLKGGRPINPNSKRQKRLARKRMGPQQ